MNKEEAWLLEEKYNGEKTGGFFADCKRLVLGEPLGYLIGSIPFLDTKIQLDSHPLIPRPETEYWTEQVIEYLKNQNTPTLDGVTQPLHVLDLCAGSGCIGVAIAQALPLTHIDFAELEPNHIPTIEKNLSENVAPSNENPAEDLYRVFHSDLFTSLPPDTKYDVIVSNPPYIDKILDRVDDSVRLFEPAVALYGGIGGMEVIERIIEQAPDYLVPHGQLWIEHEPEQSKIIQVLATKHGYSATTHTDQYGVERYTVLVLQ